MLDIIGQSNQRSIIRPENTAGTANSEPAAREFKETVATRPIEKTEESAKAKADQKKEKEASSKNKLENNEVVFEKYNSSGELIIRIPPEKPVDERV
jgi:hypothetical protein